ncbi:MAG: hypothetical protein ONA69_08325, partial [candidate division KSB1 bacterium]|nr:hypothetical protein [candidate division KSB1 bacterium]
DSLLVKVTDAYDNPKSEWPVHFAMLSSVGSLEGESEKTVLTNSKGIAGVRLQLGEAVGDSIYIVEATSRYNGELLPHPVQFYASCRRLPPTRLVALTPTIGLRGAPQRPLPYSIVVQVLDSAGSPVAEVPVEWKVLQGGGSLNSPPSVSAVSSTNGLGKAEAVWILGRMGEPQLLSAACLYDGLPLSGSPILFRAETEAPRLDALAAVGDTLIRARPATVISLQVRTLDQFREPMADQLVTFSVLSGDARWRETIDPSLTLHSSAEGVVTAELITGVKPAVIEAVSFGPQGRLLGNAIVRFTVVPAGPRLIIAAGDGQSAPVGSRLPTPLTVRAVDENEQGIGGIEVTFTPTVGDGRLLDAAQQTTDAQGYATVGYQLGLKSGLHRIRAASALGEVEFSARAVAGEASQLVVVKGDGQTGVAGHPLNQKLIVQVKDAFDNGVPKVTVYFEPEQGFAEPPQAAADSLGFVGCEWTLGLEAGEQTLTARLEGTAQTRFTAAALPNQAPVLVLPDSIVVDENQPMRLTIEAHDPENDSLSIVVLNLPAGAQFDVAKREFSWHPNYDQAGRYSPVFYAADHLGAAAMRVLPIIVRNVNRPPVIAEEICRPTVRDLGAVHKNEPIDFYAAARDPDGDPLHFIWTVMGRPTALGQMFHFAPQTFNGAIEVK